MVGQLTDDIDSLRDRLVATRTGQRWCGTTWLMWWVSPAGSPRWTRGPARRDL